MNSDVNRTTETQKKQRIWHAVLEIPHGKVATYGQIATLAGLPGAARFTGSALKNLPKNTEIPWHRVVNSSGKLSLPAGSIAHRIQRERLASECITVKNNRVRLQDFLWQP